MTDKQQAILKILKVLKSMMGVTNRFNREEALTLAKEHGITVAELITVWSDMAMRI